MINIVSNTLTILSGTATRAELEEIIGACAGEFMKVLREYLARFPDLRVVMPTDMEMSVDGDRITLEYTLRGIGAADLIEQGCRGGMPHHEA